MKPQAKISAMQRKGDSLEVSNLLDENFRKVLSTQGNKTTRRKKHRVRIHWY